MKKLDKSNKFQNKFLSTHAISKEINKNSSFYSARSVMLENYSGEGNPNDLRIAFVLRDFQINIGLCE